MLKRFWMIVSAAWALLCLWGARTAMKGAAQDVYLALAPFVLCSLLARAARFVVTGSVLKLGAPDPIAGHVWIGFKPARHAKVIPAGT